jgi:hypothetical protein
MDTCSRSKESKPKYMQIQSTTVKYGTVLIKYCISVYNIDMSVYYSDMSVSNMYCDILSQY